jgi:starch synthase
VHAVGGLRDTVKHRRTGFSFTGDNPQARAEALVKTLRRAIKLFRDEPAKWQKLCVAAAAQRFSWADSIDAYLRKLYLVK